jgi:hypothetical protein
MDNGYFSKCNQKCKIVCLEESLLIMANLVEIFEDFDNKLLVYVSIVL